MDKELNTMQINIECGKEMTQGKADSLEFSCCTHLIPKNQELFSFLVFSVIQLAVRELGLEVHTIPLYPLSSYTWRNKTQQS